MITTPCFPADTMPVLIERPGVSDSREQVMVRVGYPVAHLRGLGWDFPRVSWRIEKSGNWTVLRDDSRGIHAQIEG